MARFIITVIEAGVPDKPAAAEEVVMTQPSPRIFNKWTPADVLKCALVGINLGETQLKMLESRLALPTEEST